MRLRRKPQEQVATKTSPIDIHIINECPRAPAMHRHKERTQLPHAPAKSNSRN